MRLKYDTFIKGMQTLSYTYLDWKFNIDDDKMMATWYSRLIDMIADEDFLSAVNFYCHVEEKGPASPLSIKIRYIEDKLHMPEPTLFTYALIEEVNRMRLSDFLYEEPSIEEQKEYLLNTLSTRYPSFRDDCVLTVIRALINDYFPAMLNIVWRNDPTEVSILRTELKSSYRKKFTTSVSHMVIAGGLIQIGSEVKKIEG